MLNFYRTIEVEVNQLVRDSNADFYTLEKEFKMEKNCLGGDMIGKPDVYLLITHNCGGRKKKRVDFHKEQINWDYSRKAYRIDYRNPIYLDDEKFYFPPNSK